MLEVKCLDDSLHNQNRTHYKCYFTPIIFVSNEENYINTYGRYVSLQLFLKQHDMHYDYKKSDPVVK